MYNNVAKLTERRKKMDKSIPQSSQQGAKVSLREKLGYACSPLTMEMLSNFASLYMMVFFTNVCGISPAAAGTLMLLCTLWNAINDPLIGFIADNRRFNNGEKMRPYLKFFSLPVALFLVLLFWMPDLDPVMSFIYALVVFFFYDSFITIIQMPTLSLPMLMSDDPAQRISINVWFTLGSNIGSIVSALAAIAIMRVFGGVAADGSVLNARAGYRGAVVVFALIMLAGQYIAYFSTRERVMPMNTDSAKIQVKRLLGLLFGERNWILNMLYALCYVLCAQMVANSVVYFAAYVLHRPGYEQVLAPALLISSILSLPFVSMLNKRISRRGILILGGVLFFLSKVPFVFFPRALWAVFFNVIVLGVGAGLSTVGISANQAEVTDIIEWRRGYRIEGSVNAIRSLIYKGLGASVPFLLGLLMQASGYIAPTDAMISPEQNAATQGVFISLFGWLPMITGALMILLGVVIPTDRDAAKMRADKIESQQGDASTQMQGV